MIAYDALLLVSYGGPERSDDVMPFLQNVVRGRNVPQERLARVAEHYELFDGVSPINAENRALLAALVGQLNAHGVDLPVYWGNRHWHPLLTDTIRQMADDGVQRALAFATSAFGSYPGCRAYREAIEAARDELGGSAPEVEKLRLFYNQPGFIEPTAERVEAALAEIDPERRNAARIVFTAHSLPTAMAGSCPYERQLRESCGLVADRLGLSDWCLVYQSRSGPPSQPWLEPDLCDYLRGLDPKGGDVVLVPIGFVCEHMEIVYDLDIEAAAVCRDAGLNMVRSATVGSHPRFVEMIRELITERIDDSTPPAKCHSDCCRPR